MFPDFNEIKFIRLLNKINSGYEPVFIPIVTESFATINECFSNVQKKVDLDGGSIVYGWQIWITELICEAEFHAIWKTSEGKLIDITPKIPHVDAILFVQDDSTTYKGVQIDNIRVNNTENPIVNDFIDIHRNLFKIRNKGERAFHHKCTLSREEATVYLNLETFSLALKNYIYQGGQTNTYCFCGSGWSYADCHRIQLDALIMRSKAI
ncbi:hypothetical protein [Paenibacillus odorifer]|uniref:hypothetical protein n=1 Tax=Paenibacillus odorifer TaxID=189426 RepID=UPI000BA182DF|nr:hypothetical protein [Paenibacillus odorifer]OZQ77433.1 hypothetical protein CA596_07655 [Paenibacillus odorifer]